MHRSDAGRTGSGGEDEAAARCDVEQPGDAGGVEVVDHHRGGDVSQPLPRLHTDSLDRAGAGVAGLEERLDGVVESHVARREVDDAGQAVSVATRRSIVERPIPRGPCTATARPARASATRSAASVRRP